MQSEDEVRSQAWPSSQLTRIDAVCDRFEAAWEAGGEPEVEDFLRDVPETLRPPLRRELMAIAAQRRAKRIPAHSVERFGESVINAGLMTRAEWQTFLNSLPARPDPADIPTLIRQLVATNRLTAYQATELAEGRTDRLRFDEYVILDRIGAGGMGEVFKARHRAMDRIVALKFLAERAVHSPEAIARFQREVRAAARLSHPNIVTAYDARQQGSRHSLIMEYVEGSDLSSRVRRHGPLPVEHALACILQAARGLRYAHEHGVVHRDIKPANLLLDHQGTVKILDMGLAQLDSVGVGQDDLTCTGQIMGTVDYMAPEQAMNTKLADARADIYSLGVTLWYLLTARRLYAGETALEKIVAHRTEPIPSLREACPEASPALDAVFRRMVAKTPAERYQSMAELIRDFEPLVDHATTVSHVSGAPEDSKLDSFLRGLGPSSPSSRKSKALRNPTPPPVADPDVTEDWSGPHVGTDPGIRHPQASGAPGRPVGKKALPVSRRRWRPDWRTVATCVMAAAGFLVVAVLGLRPGQRTPDAPPGMEESATVPGVVPAAPPVVSSELDRARLILRWPSSERAETRLEIDGQVYELAELAHRETADQVVVPLEPGDHRVWIVRRGFEPFEQTIRLSPGDELALTPQWSALPGTGLPDEPIAGQPGGEEAEPDEPRVVESIAPEVGTLPVDPAIEPTGPTPEEVAALEAFEAAEATWRAATGASAEKAAAWDFAGALAALDDVRFDSGPLTARLAQRKDELRRMGDLKERMIARINSADPPLKKADLMLRGVGGEVSAADQQAITATQTTGRKESLLWSDLGTQAPGKLLELAVDRTRADDWLSAGVFALDIGNVDLAERLLARAGQMGLDIRPYRDPLAQAAFDAARMLLDAGDFSQAADALAALETKYSSIPWWSMNQSAVAAARAAAAEGLHEHEANELYTKAAEYFAQNELFEVKALLEKLGAEYGDIVTLLNPAGRPPLAELKQSVATLGHRISVCLNGKGDFQSIQAAIDAAPANSLIEIQDSGPYNEQVAIQTVGLTLRGAADAWPVITSLGANRDFERLVHVLGDGTTLERLIIVHGTSQGDDYLALDVGAAGCRIRAVMSIVPRAEQSEAKAFGCWNKAGAWTDLADCLFIGESLFAAPARAANCLFVSEFTNFHGTCRIEHCTVSKKTQFVLSESIVRNSIIGSVHIFDQALQSFRMECCNIFGPDRFWGHKEPKTGFFFGDPRFRDPPNLDYRLMPNSPCIGKADNGGDLGVRYTPEMTEMVRRALEMRARGIIQF